MPTNGYIDEIAFWDYDESTGKYTKLHTERAMSFKDFLDCIERLRPQCDVINWKIDGTNLIIHWRVYTCGNHCLPCPGVAE